MYSREWNPDGRKLDYYPPGFTAVIVSVLPDEFSYDQRSSEEPIPVGEYKVELDHIWIDPDGTAWRWGDWGLETRLISRMSIKEQAEWDAKLIESTEPEEPQDGPQ